MSCSSKVGASNASSLIPFDKIVLYRDARIVIRPLKSNGDPDATNLFTEAEIIELTNALTETQ